jgi:outer membrane receptor protein involved in Fe transport
MQKLAANGSHGKLSPYRDSVRTAVAAVLLAACTAVSTAQAARTVSARLAAPNSFDIPSQPLGASLKQLAEQAGIQILFEEDAVRGLQAPALRANQSTLQALDTLLRSTGLESRASNETVAVRRKPTARLEAARTDTRTAFLVPTAEPAAPRIRLAQADEPRSSAEGELRGAEGSQDGSRSGELNEVLVTGSRIARDSYDTSTPTTILDSTAIQNSGLSNVGEALLQVPSVGVGLTSATSNYGDATGDVSTLINLRGLGVDRTLTLVNGRRRVSGSISSSGIDLSMIPAGMVERIDVITGGAAAVYGADAVTGVVNIVLKTDVEGLEISGRTGFSQDGGAGTRDISVFAGTRFAEDRGSASFGISYSDENPLMGRQRSFGREPLLTTPNDASTGPDDGIPDQIHVDSFRFPNTHPAGTFFIDGQRYTIDPTLRLTQNDRVFGGAFGGTASGGDGFNLAEFDQLRVERDALAVHASFKYAMHDRVNLFAEADFATVNVFDRRQPPFDFDLPIQRDNPFIPAELGALMDAEGLAALAVTRDHYDHGIITEQIEKTSHTVVAGVEGDFATDMAWQVFAQYGQMNGDSERLSRIESRFLEALDAVADPLTGAPVCRSPEAQARGCVPLSILGRNAATPEALAYFQHGRLREITNTQEIAGAQLTGSLFALPAGQLKFASGLEHRREGLATRPDGLASTGQLFRFDGDGLPLDAHFEVDEAFLELLAPLARDRTLLHSLDLEAAIRVSDYSTIGSTTAWKLASSWAPVNDVRFRVTRSKSVRAPNLTELFLPNTLVNEFVLDPCDASIINDNPNRLANCAALGVPAGFVDLGGVGNVARIGGNPELQEEVSQSLTVGVVLAPSFLPAFSLSLDYWKIEIDDAINSIGIQTIADRCVDLASLDNPFCSLVNRRADFVIDYVDAPEINISTLTAQGVDFQASYRFDALRGRFGASLNGTYLLEHEELVDATDRESLIIRRGGSGYPRLRTNLALRYAQGGLTLDLMTRLIGSMKAEVEARPEQRDRNRASTKVYNDLTAAYEFGGSYRVQAGVNNLFNVIPPRIEEFALGGGNRGGNGGGSLYDNIGRFFFVGGSVAF